MDKRHTKRLGKGYADVSADFRARCRDAVGQHVRKAWENEVATGGEDAERCRELLAAYRGQEWARVVALAAQRSVGAVAELAHIAQQGADDMARVRACEALLAMAASAAQSSRGAADV